MTINLNELLSALVDDELQGDELAQALTLIHSDEQFKQQWLSYQHASDILHGHSVGPQNNDLTGLIAQRLRDEPSYLLKPQAAKLSTFAPQIWKQAASLAVAASIGALAVVGVINQPDGQLVPRPQLTVAENLQPVIAARNGKRWAIGEQDIEQRLNTYLVDHNEYTGASGVFSYARVVSYDAGQ
mgnify:FL=1